MIAGYFTPRISNTLSIIDMILYTGYTFSHILTSIVLKTHQFFLLSIRKRYQLINALMRYNLLKENDNFILIEHFFRKKFLNVNSNAVPLETIRPETPNTVNFIKSMSRLHDRLGEILIDVNYCYSFQV